MAYYQIRLTPVENFFFGGEKHNHEEVTNYFVESNYFPQQTTLLGFMRYLMLVKHNLIGTGNIKTEGVPVIGKESFDFGNTALTFGKIKSLSPLYFLLDGTIFIPAPLDLDFILERVGGNFILKKNNSVYTTKMGALPLTLSDRKGGNPILVYDDEPGKSVIFKVSQTGNEKAKQGESRDESFYKQDYLKMNPGWSFAIQAEIEEDLAEETMFLPFGGEQSMFKVDIQKQEVKVNLVPELEKYRRNIAGLYLISDCFAESSLLNLTCFAVNQIVSFRNFRSSVNTSNYAAFGKTSNGLKRSARYNLLSRGSVLYFPDETARQAAIGILTKDHCINIGFNNWKLIN